MQYNKEKEMLYISGKLIKLCHEPLVTYVKGKKKTGDEPYYQFCVLTDEDQDTADQIDALYYTDAEDQFKPKWIKGEAESEDGKIFVNFKSRYDIKYFLPDEDHAYNLDSLTESKGNIVGSDVTLAVKCKERALYVSALRVDTLKSVSVSDYFA